MSAKLPTTAASNKDNTKQSDIKVGATGSCLKQAVPAIKIAVNKVVTIQQKEMSPGAPPMEEDRPELLGSLTTEQQQRTSARVIKKLRLEPQPKRPDAASDEVQDCETPGKVEDKDLKFPTVKQRMPKALWSTDEKNLFFEALNEYGKDFDAITSYICAKMKKKGMPDSNLKTKTQVSHFYYRTWHKLSKHVRFDENVKKVAQELYALINYGELRKKLVSVNEKTCGRLGEMVVGGSMVVRARGRNLRVRTPMCRALRRLNQITEGEAGCRVYARCTVCLRARHAGAWARVQAAAHNPRAQLHLPPRTRLARLLHALQARWKTNPAFKAETEGERKEYARNETDLENHLNLELDRVIVEEHKQHRKMALHVGPRPDADIHLPVASPAEQLSSQKICFSSYLERMGDQRNNAVKIRTNKRQRKDSNTDKEKELEQKKIKTDEKEDVKLINIEETAIDGIELMANYKSYKNFIEYENERPSTEDEKDVKSEETAEDEVEKEIERDKDIFEREKDSFSEMEDDEKYNKSDTDNESDGKSGKERKFKNLKVKFRIRPKKRGGSVYTLVTDDAKEADKQTETDKRDTETVECEREKADIDVDLALRQIRRGWSARDAGALTVGDLYLMFGNRSKIELDYWWAESSPPLPKPELEKDSNRQGRQADKTPDKGDNYEEARESDTDIFSPKMYAQDSNDGLSGDERKNEQLLSPEHKSSSSTLKLVSKLVNRPHAPPPNTGFSLLSERLKRLLALAGNAHVSAAGGLRCGAGGAGGAGGAACARRKPPPPPPAPYLDHTLFRHPPPIAPKTEKAKSLTLDVEELPRGRRGRPRLAEQRIVVQRLLPLLPKLPPPSTLIPVKIVPDAQPTLPKILPKPPPTSTSDLSLFYVLSESNGQFYFHDGDRRIPITQPPRPGPDDSEDEIAPKSEVLDVDEGDEPRAEPSLNPGGRHGARSEPRTDHDIGSFLPSESMSLSPSRLLRDAEWLDGSVDFSLSSFLGQLEARAPPDLAVDSQLHSLMAETSVDYVAKFADLAAVVSDGTSPDPPAD